MKSNKKLRKKINNIINEVNNTDVNKFSISNFNKDIDNIKKEYKEYIKTDNEPIDDYIYENIRLYSINFYDRNYNTNYNTNNAANDAANDKKQFLENLENLENCFYSNIRIKEIIKCIVVNGKWIIGIIITIILGLLSL